MCKSEINATLYQLLKIYSRFVGSPIVVLYDIETFVAKVQVIAELRHKIMKITAIISTGML